MEMLVILLVFVGGYLTCFVIDLFFFGARVKSAIKHGYVSGVTDTNEHWVKRITEEMEKKQ